jgi:D-alanyl-D-alanine carboxypeptidase
MRFLWAIFCSFLLVFGMSERLLAYDVRGGTSYIVVDAKTSEILDEKNAYGYKYPASLTKMMTLYVLFSELKRKNLSLESKLQVSNYAASKPASKLYLQPGNTIKVEDAIKALIVKSANDVAVVVAEAIGGSEKEFAKIMTRQARKIGMVRTSFKNASGLHNSKQVSTAFDMYKLALAIQDQFPEYYEYFDLEYFD